MAVSLHMSSWLEFAEPAAATAAAAAAGDTTQDAPVATISVVQPVVCCVYACFGDTTHDALVATISAVQPAVCVSLCVFRPPRQVHVCVRARERARGVCYFVLRLCV